MNDNLLDQYAFALSQLKQKNNHRHLEPIIHNGRFIYHHAKKPMLNLASNDYLGLANNHELKTAFITNHASDYNFSSSSSRLLTGNFAIYEQLENDMQNTFGRACLLFNSGYHMNIGILPALADKKTLILADKFIHASIIDGILLSQATLKRYRHQDLLQLQDLLIKHHDDQSYNKIIIVSESLFSMDGDITDLKALVNLKKQFPKVMLYIDEAHAFGVMGENGLGLSEHYQVIDDIDMLVGTFGKAAASVGGYLICHQIIKDYLINTMRSLIFSTALPPINIAWTRFIFHHLITQKKERQHLAHISQQLIYHIKQLNLPCPSQSHIIPIILGDNERALGCAKHLQDLGFYVLAVRPPTVPQGQARLRLCLNSTLYLDELTALKNALNQCLLS